MLSTDIVFTATGSQVVVAGTEGGMWMSALNSDRRATPPAKSSSVHHGTVTAVDVSSDTCWLILAGLDRQLELWRMPRCIVTVRQSPLIALQTHPDRSA